MKQEYNLKMNEELVVVSSWSPEILCDGICEH